MAKTPFSQKRFEDSNNVHREYRDLIYPDIFPGVKKEDVTYDDNVSEDIKQYHDFEEARDVLLSIKHPKWRHPAEYTGQYRFRNAQEFQRYQDLTITLFNNASGQPGEFFKLLVLLFVYGYYDFSIKRLVEIMVADSPRMRISILDGILPYKIGYNPRSRQPFIAVKFTDLYKHDLVLLHWKEVNGERQILYRRPRQFNPHAPLSEGVKRAEQSVYGPKGQPKRITLTAKEIKIISETPDGWEDND